MAAVLVPEENIYFFNKIIVGKTKNMHFSIDSEAKFFEKGLKIREYWIFSEL